MPPNLFVSAATAAVLLLTATACGSSEPPRSAPTNTPGTAAPADAPKVSAVEVKDAVLVRNSARTATLSATIVNNSKQAHRLISVYIDMDEMDRHDELEPPQPAAIAAGFPLKPGETSRLGRAADPFRLRVIGTKDLTRAIPLTLQFDTEEDVDGTSVTLDVPIVERTADHADIVDDGPIPEVQLTEGKIVVVPGQKQAYVTGYLESSIDDIAVSLPTATHADGRPITWQYTTETGGPYGNFAEKGKKALFGRPAPFLAYTDGGHGDPDHLLAADVTIGEIVTVRLRFNAGDVVGKLKVVQGKADGTL